MSEALQLSSAVATAPSSAALLPREMKSPTAFRTISEVADDLSLPQHVLRFWESKFQQIKPLKRGGGRRYYRPEDVKVIHDIKELLYNQGFTIRGVQKLLRESSGSSLARSMVAQPQLPISIPSAPQAHAAAMNALAEVQLAAHATAPQNQPGLSSDKRREVEGVLAELRAMRKLLQQGGI